MQYFITISSQGQIRIPSKVRRELGLHTQQKAMLEVQGQSIVIHPIPNISSLKGIFQSKKRGSRTEERESFLDAVSRGEA